VGRYVARRLLAFIPVLVVASIIVFLMAHLTPSDPALVIAGGRQTSAETLAAIRAKYRLNDPLPAQYIHWAGNALHGDLGESFKLKQEVGAMIGVRLPVTVQLILMSIVISLAVSVPLGILAALRKDKAADRIISILSLAGLSSPVFLTGLFCVLLFSYTLGWLPSIGTGENAWENFRYLLLPSSALALNMIAQSLRITRNGMIQAMESNYVQTAVVKGLPRWRVVVRHALRNALIPLVTVSSLQLGFLLTGTVLVEYTFGIAGVGGLLVTAIQTSDYPVVQGTTLFVVAFFLAVNMLVDVLYAVIDPRIRYT
jgi:peptide/nickel transport system permease protein